MKTYALTPTDRETHRQLYKHMFAQRTRIFAELLAWDNMVIIDGEERDEADRDPNVHYLVTLDSIDQFVGSCRLTPTQGECLLAGPLAYYLDQPLEQCPQSWELTRFAPATNPKDPRHGQSFGALCAGVVEWALQSNVTKIYGIAEPGLMGILGSLGVQVTIEGPPIVYQPGKTAFAFSFPADLETLEFARRALRLTGPVLIQQPTRIGVAA